MIDDCEIAATGRSRGSSEQAAVVKIHCEKSCIILLDPGRGCFM